MSNATPRDLETKPFKVVLPLRRQVRNFIAGRRSTIKLLYIGSDELDIRWFRKSDGDHLPNAEVANMLTAEGKALNISKQVNIEVLMRCVVFVEIVDAPSRKRNSNTESIPKFVRLLTYVNQCVAINCFMLVGKPHNIIV